METITKLRNDENMGIDRIQKVIQEFTKALQILYGDRLQGVLLYGSYARGDATENSDIDLMIILRDKVAFSKEIERMNVAATDILLEYGELISLYPVSNKIFSQINTPFLMNAKKEGIQLWKI